MARRRSPQTVGPPAPVMGDGSAQVRHRAAESALDHISFGIGRAYYNHLGMLERVLVEMDLDKYVQPGMGYILFALFERDDQAIKEIVDRAEVSHSTLSGMLRRMKRAGIVDLRRDVTDGRSVRVRLTPLGKSLEPRCHLALAKVHDIMTAGASDTEIRGAQRTLKKMTKAMRNYERQQRVP